MPSKTNRCYQDSPEHAKAKGEHDRKMGNGNKNPYLAPFWGDPDKASREKRERNKMAYKEGYNNKK